MKINVRPVGDRILVEAVEEKETKKGGIIIPGTAKEKPMESLVIALGTGKTDDKGNKIPFEVKRVTVCWWPNRAARKSRWTGRITEFSPQTNVLAVIE